MQPTETARSFRSGDRVVVHSIRSVFHHKTGTVEYSINGVTVVCFDGETLNDDVLTSTLRHYGEALV